MKQIKILGMGFFVEEIKKIEFTFICQEYAFKVILKNNFNEFIFTCKSPKLVKKTIKEITQNNIYIS